MASRRRQEGGKKPNAEGMHGDKTHQALQEQLKHGLPEPVDPELNTRTNRHTRDAKEGSPRDANEGSLEAHTPGPDGKHRLFEDRQQHDEADKNSEKNRLAKEQGVTSGENK